MDRFVPRFLYDRYIRFRIWRRDFSFDDWDAERVFKTSLYLTEWLLQIILLALFWLFIIPPIMDNDFFVGEELGEVIREFVLVCTRPTVKGFIILISSAVALNLLFNFILRCRRLTSRQYHVMSATIGYVLLQINCNAKCMVVIMVFMLIIFLLVNRLKVFVERDRQIIRPVYTITLILTTILCLGEFFFPYERVWEGSRAIMMVMTMKVISISTDDYCLKRITTVELVGYLLCPASVLFGPWMSMDTYTLNNVHRQKLSAKWFTQTIQAFTYAMAHMILSNCLVQSITPISDAFYIPMKWHEALRNSFAFRSSNYCTGYMAEFTMLTAGFNAYQHYDEEQRWDYPVARPSNIECPRSMAVVLKNWNIPAYRFFKDCVYSPFSEINYVCGLTMTFVLALLLNGFNARMMLILLTMGILSYSQEIIQDKLAYWFDCCCCVNPCDDECEHRFGPWNPITLIINGFNMVINVSHLAYLGYVMDRKFERTTIYELYEIWEDEFGVQTHFLMLVWWATMLFIS
ncbi:protein-serine O-palmitoleoyltransferase porcupine-like [Onthophagus taurus]|uniref:protein-serine O-palmitoleoyltransferase porcupine-like n=1 Tax=Onthophagus taurus TaxID=166361 RepID=UPI0039BEB951